MIQRSSPHRRILTGEVHRSSVRVWSVIDGLVFPLAPFFASDQAHRCLHEPELHDVGG